MTARGWEETPIQGNYRYKSEGAAAMERMNRMNRNIDKDTSQIPDTKRQPKT